MTQEGYYQRSQAALVWYILHLILTLIQIPALFFARNAIRKEVPSWMIGFLVVHGLIIIDFIIVLQQSANSWVFWVLAVCLAILLSVTTMILGIVVTRNFGKGLQPHIQRLFDERYLENVKYNNNNVTKGDSWVIDDDPQQNENV
ncbi:hypothetical protein BJ944DRAFT_210276 [Cunninghamella echinulata]|nr:hypothetical protein BJ944DRAFT_210276 [Cunninghamella echinulata]